MSLSLSMSTKQQTRISPVMRLGMELLALPLNDLKAAVKKELDSNPALSGSSPIVIPPMIRLASGGYVIDNAKAKGKTLAEHLLSELRMSGIDDRRREICEAVVCEIDEAGHFKGDVRSIALTFGVGENEVEAARKLVMTIDPKGCGARDLGECLLAQSGIVPKELREKFAANIGDILAGKASKAVLEEFKPYIRRMKANPGQEYSYVRIDYVTPDVTVDSDGGVTVDTGDLPELAVSPRFIDMAGNAELDEETRQYAAEKVKRAREFMTALERRQTMLAKICEQAVHGQDEFLVKGPSAMKVQTMSAVAKLVGCDVSTVSRAAEKKYVKTPFGTIHLRKFFTLNDQKQLDALRKLIEENPKASDQRLSTLMSAAGYTMARRTVSKWRSRLQAGDKEGNMK